MYFLSDLNNDANVIALGYDSEQATLHRIAPTLIVPEPAFAAVMILTTAGLLLRRRRFFSSN